MEQQILNCEKKMKEYIGSQEHFEDELNAYYEQEKYMNEQIEKQYYEQTNSDYTVFINGEPGNQ